MWENFLPLGDSLARFLPMPSLALLAVVSEYPITGYSRCVDTILDQRILLISCLIPFSISKGIVTANISGEM